MMHTPCELKTLAIALIECDDAIQPREYLTPEALEDYEELYRESKDGDSPLPPIDVFLIDGRYYVADGFHRLWAAAEARLSSLPCNVYRGTLRDAMLHAIEANTKRGLPYSFGDKERILTRLLEDEEIRQLSNRQVARRYGFSHTYVNKIRKRIAAQLSLDQELASSVETVSTSGKRRNVLERQQLAAILGCTEADLKVAKDDRRVGDVSSIKHKIIAQVADDGQDYAEAKAAVAAIVQEVVSEKAARKSRNATRRIIPPRPPEPEPTERSLHVAVHMLAALFQETPPSTNTPEETLQSLQQTAGAISCRTDDSGELPLMTCVNLALTAFEAGAVAIDDICAEELHAAFATWCEEAVRLCEQRIREWGSLKFALQNLHDGLFLRTLLDHLSASRLKLDPATAKQYGKAIAALESYIESQPTLAEHPARRIVNL